jgi:PAS domain S-box-containing protein
MVTFGIVLVIVGGSIAITDQQINQINSDAQKARNIQNGISSLSYISNDYLQNRKDAALNLWDNIFSNVTSDLSQIHSGSLKQAELINNTGDDLQRLNSIFDEAASYIASIPQNESGVVHQLLKTHSTRLSVQNQALSFDSSVLSLSLENQANQLRQTNNLLIVLLLGVFGAYFVTTYLIAFRRTLNSIGKLQESTKIVGSGNLDHSVVVEGNDEISILSHDFNKMMVNLKAVTASKATLEGLIREREKVEKILKESEQLYHTIFDNSQDGFQLIELVYDANGKPIDHKFLKVNHAYEKIIGVRAEDILDKTAKYISPNQEPHWLEVPDRVAKTGISEHVELYNKDIDKTLDCHYFLYSKNVVGTLFRDITERKRMEKQLQDSERLAAIGATAGMVGHDIRNPLQAITSDVYLAESELASIPESEEKKNALESLQEISKNTDYINKIVQDLQDYARPLNPKGEESDLRLILERLVIKNSFSENVKITIDVDDEVRKIRADLYYLNRIFYNLIINSIQAMPQGGNLSIQAYREEKETVISVSDTGVGIPKDLRGKMFTLMFTTKAKGQGFGLPVVKRMVESLGGSVKFESEEGKGTTFFVRLPNPKI